MNRNAIAVIAAGILGYGCATTPAVDESLTQAREAYQQAQADPHVARFAAPELAEATQALTRAEQLAASGADAAQLAHHAYLAEQRAHIAQQLAMARAAEAELARAGSQRERVILQARVREAEAAKARAEAAQAQLKQSEVERRDALRAELARLESQIADLKTADSERGVVLRLGSEVLFASGEATLKPGARRALENVARFLGREPERRILIEGFTDSVGPDDFNQRLSERRAHAVRQALVEMGVPAERITARGLGESYPVASNDTAAGRQMNRRVEIVMPREQGAASVGGTR